MRPCSAAAAVRGVTTRADGVDIWVGGGLLSFTGDVVAVVVVATPWSSRQHRPRSSGALLGVSVAMAVVRMQRRARAGGGFNREDAAPSGAAARGHSERRVVAATDGERGE
jgi:hypothetical protein